MIAEVAVMEMGAVIAEVAVMEMEAVMEMVAMVVEVDRRRSRGMGGDGRGEWAMAGLETWAPTAKTHCCRLRNVRRAGPRRSARSSPRRPA